MGKVAEARKKKKSKTESKAASHADFLSLLAKAKQKNKRDQLLDFASNDQVLAVIECIYNVLRGAVPLASKEIGNLRKHRKPMRYLCDKKTSVREKRRVLKQKGGFLGFLLGPIISSVLSSVVKPLVGGRDDED